MFNNKTSSNNRTINMPKKHFKKIQNFGKYDLITIIMIKE